MGGHGPRTKQLACLMKGVEPLTEGYDMHAMHAVTNIHVYQGLT